MNPSASASLSRHSFTLSSCIHFFSSPHFPQPRQPPIGFPPIKNISVSIPSSFKVFATSASAVYVQPLFLALPLINNTFICWGYYFNLFYLTWNPEPEGRTFAKSRFYANLPVHLLYKTLTDGQPHTHALCKGVDFLESVKDALLVFLFDSDACIFDFNQHAVVFNVIGDDDSTRRGEFVCIGNK